MKNRALSHLNLLNSGFQKYPRELMNMNKTWISFAVIISLTACAAAVQNGMEMRPGEARAEMLFDLGIGEPWVGGNPPSSSAYESKFSQFFSMHKGSFAKKHIEAPKKLAIKDKTPTTVYFSYQMKSIPYSQYQSYAANAGGNSFWVQGSTSWTQYAQVPQGSSLSLLAISSTGGNGYLYETTPDGKSYRNDFYFYPGNSQINFYADTIGKHVLQFVIGGQVSNTVVIDVTSYYPTIQQPVYAYPPTQVLPPTSGDTPVTIVSKGMRGYQVYLDGEYIGTEGNGGDPLDGRFSFKVVGNQNHDIRVYDGQFNYPKTIYFARGVTKMIYVEPGRAVYI